MRTGLHHDATGGRRVRDAARDSVAVRNAPVLYADEGSVYQKSLPLTPGKYKLDIVAKDTVSGNMNRSEVALEVPRYDPEKLATSSLILADGIDNLPLKKVGGEMFAIGDFKVRPRVTGQFSRDEKLGMYLQIYNLAPGQSERKPRGNVRYEIARSGSDEPLIEQTEELANVPDASIDQVTIRKLVSLHSLAPGLYTLKLKVSDGGRTLQRQAQFSVR